MQASTPMRRACTILDCETLRSANSFTVRIACCPAETMLDDVSKTLTHLCRWIGEARPAAGLEAEVPVNPIKWSLSLCAGCSSCAAR